MEVLGCLFTSYLKRGRVFICLFVRLLVACLFVLVNCFVHFLYRGPVG